MLSVVVMVMGSASLKADEKKPALSAAEIISKHLEAAGGKEELSQFESRIAIGTITMFQ